MPLVSYLNAPETRKTERRRAFTKEEKEKVEFFFDSFIDRLYYCRFYSKLSQERVHELKDNRRLRQKRKWRTTFRVHIAGNATRELTHRVTDDPERLTYERRRTFLEDIRGKERA